MHACAHICAKGIESQFVSGAKMSTLSGLQNLATKEHLTVDSDVDLDSDEFSQDDVKVNIAIFGKSGSGRSSFVNALTGYVRQ